MLHSNHFNTGTLDLFIGRKRTRITEPSRFEVSTELEEQTYQDVSFTVARSQSYQLFISDKLFASVRVFPTQRYARAPIKIVKPKRGRGPIQIHFVKKYVTLH